MLARYEKKGSIRSANKTFDFYSASVFCLHSIYNIRHAWKDKLLQHERLGRTDTSEVEENITGNKVKQRERLKEQAGASMKTVFKLMTYKYHRTGDMNMKTEENIYIYYFTYQGYNINTGNITRKKYQTFSKLLTLFIACVAPATPPTTSARLLTLLQMII